MHMSDIVSLVLLDVHSFYNILCPSGK
jgi:hypothetical protein